MRIYPSLIKILVLAIVVLYASEYLFSVEPVGNIGGPLASGKMYSPETVHLTIVSERSTFADFENKRMIWSGKLKSVKTHVQDGYQISCMVSNEIDFIAVPNNQDRSYWNQWIRDHKTNETVTFAGLLQDFTMDYDKKTIVFFLYDAYILDQDK